MGFLGILPNTLSGILCQLRKPLYFCLGIGQVLAPFGLESWGHLRHWLVRGSCPFRLRNCHHDSSYVTKGQGVADRPSRGAQLIRATAGGQPRPRHALATVGRCPLKFAPTARSSAVNRSVQIASVDYAQILAVRMVLRPPKERPSALRSRRPAHTGREIMVVVPRHAPSEVKQGLFRSQSPTVVMSGVKVQPMAPANALATVETVPTVTVKLSPLPSIISPSPSTKPVKSRPSASVVAHG